MQENNPPIRHIEGQLQVSGSTGLYWQSWTPPEKPIAVLILIHGFGEHSGRYPYFVERLCADNIAVFAFDLRGHGKTTGRRGHIQSINEFRDDVGAFVKNVRSELPGVPVFIFGHSMGSLVVLDYVLRHPEGLAGTIISGSGLEPAGVATAPVVFLARVLSVVWPVFPIRLPVDATGLSRIESEIERYNNDPLVHNISSARMANELLNAIDWIKTHPQDLQIPLLMVHGEADRVNLPSGSSNFFSAVSFPDKELVLYPGGFHELHNDLDKEKELGDIIRWLHDRVESNSTAAVDH